MAYGARILSKFNNILTPGDISFWCTNFLQGVYFGGIFWGYKFPEGIQISIDTNFGVQIS